MNKKTTYIKPQFETFFKSSILTILTYWGIVITPSVEDFPIAVIIDLANTTKVNTSFVHQAHATIENHEFETPSFE